MPKIRPAAVAGMFYPADAKKLQTTVHHLLDIAEHSDIKPKALIAPHAGYIYSGSIAACAYNSLKNCKNNFKKIFLLGPAHTKPVKSIALPSHEYFSTPLGQYKLDTDTISKIAKKYNFEFDDLAHMKEHCLEVHIPFLQVLYPESELIPIVVGHCDQSFLADILEPYWNNKDTMFIISSDLSHYHQYTDAMRIDAQTTKAIENLDSDLISPKRACGCYPIKGILELAHRHNLKVKTIAQCNSGDTAGDKSKVVGYGAYIIYE